MSKDNTIKQCVLICESFNSDFESASVRQSLTYRHLLKLEWLPSLRCVWGGCAIMASRRSSCSSPSQRVKSRSTTTTMSPTPGRTPKYTWTMWSPSKWKGTTSTLTQPGWRNERSAIPEHNFPRFHRALRRHHIKLRPGKGNRHTLQEESIAEECGADIGGPGLQLGWQGAHHQCGDWGNSADGRRQRQGFCYQPRED